MFHDVSNPSSSPDPAASLGRETCCGASGGSRAARLLPTGNWRDGRPWDVIPPVLVRGSIAGAGAAGARWDMLRLKKFRSKMRYYGLRRLTQQLQVPTYVCKRGTNKIRAEAEVQCPCLLTLAFGANLIQPTHSDRVYEKIHGTSTHVAHR